MTKTEIKNWAIDNSELIKDLNLYISGDNLNSITNQDIHELMETFPDFSYTGKAYRFLAQAKTSDNIDLESLEFDSSHRNLSWSKTIDAYKNVAISYRLENQVIFIYSADISYGFDLSSFFLYLLSFRFDFLKKTGTLLLEEEKEILVLNYSNLELVEKFFYK